MSILRLLKRDERGAAVIEIAIVLPVLITFIWGIFQIGILFQANAGMQHALGEGARLATICEPNGAGCNSPAPEEVQARINEKVFGIAPGTFTVPLPTTDAANGFMTLTVNYSQPMNFLFFPGPTVNIARNKRVYIAQT